MAIVDKKRKPIELVTVAVRYKLGKFTKAEIMELCPSLGRATVENALRQLCAEQKIEKHGNGRDTFCVRFD